MPVLFAGWQNIPLSGASLKGENMGLGAEKYIIKYTPFSLNLSSGHYRLLHPGTWRIKKDGFPQIPAFFFGFSFHPRLTSSALGLLWGTMLIHFLVTLPVLFAFRSPFMNENSFLFFIQSKIMPAFLPSIILYNSLINNELGEILRRGKIFIVTHKHDSCNRFT